MKALNISAGASVTLNIVILLLVAFLVWKYAIPYLKAKAE